MLKTNVVEHNEFAEAQLKALNIAKDALINSFGPMGSNTMIIKENAFNKYTKDGYTILQNIQCLNIIESFAIKDIVEVTRNIVTTVGDGTTSAVILSALIFEGCSLRETLRAIIYRFHMVRFGFLYSFCLQDAKPVLFPFARNLLMSLVQYINYLHHYLAERLVLHTVLKHRSDNIAWLYRKVLLYLFYILYSLYPRQVSLHVLLSFSL